MTGSMYAAVSGLKAHMSALNVIGNNVANVNTLGYKTTRYTFNEALYATQRSGSDGTQVSGGRNPAQVGFGASIGTIDLDMSTKNYTPTGKQLDTMIDGDGFFMVGDKTTGAGMSTLRLSGEDDSFLKGMNLTRLGNFEIDSQGYLVDGNGSVVWGFVERTATAAEIAQVNGTSGTGTGTGGTGGTDTTTDAAAEEARKAMLARMHNIVYKIDETTGKPTDEIVSATITDRNLIAPIRMPMTKQTYATSADGTQAVVNNVQWPTYVPASQTDDDPPVEIPETIRYLEEGTDSNGNTIKRLEHNSATINEKSGALTIQTSDGQLLTVGYLAIGKVTNPNGVTHVDGRYYQAQDGAGDLRVTTVKGAVSGVESAGDTKLITGGLESSGTDLATEITNMITVQRGYQANTRIITVTDSMLEELVNMKR